MKAWKKVLFLYTILLFVFQNAWGTDFFVSLNNGQQMKTSFLTINKKELSLLNENGIIKVPLYAVSSIETNPVGDSLEIINSFWFNKTGDPSFLNAKAPTDKINADYFLANCQNLAAMLMFDQYAQLCDDVFYEHADINAQKAMYLYENNKLAEALSFINNLKEQERNDEILHIKGLISLELSNYKEASEIWSKAFVLKPKDSYRYLARQSYWLYQNTAHYDQDELLKIKIVYPDNIKITPAFKKLKTTILRFQEELGLFFGFPPYKKIIVLIYPNDQFNKLTGAPPWTKGFTQNFIYLSEQDDYAYVIKHELTHAFINQLSFEKAPLWFQEGLAQYLSYDHRHAFPHKHFMGYSWAQNNNGMAADDDSNQTSLYESSLDKIISILKKHDELSVRYFLTLLRKGEHETEAARKAFGN